MKKLFYLLVASTLLTLAGCRKAIFPEPPPCEAKTLTRVDIQLEKIEDDGRYINISTFESDTVFISGKYVGDRLVFSEVKDKVLVFSDGVLATTHPEDAIAFLGPVENTKIVGDCSFLIMGSLTFWDVMSNVHVTGIHSLGAFVGIRATQDKPHTNVLIEGNSFSYITLEAIYIGPSKEGQYKSTNIAVLDNTFHHIGWDAIQIGNCFGYIISGNVIDSAGVAKVWGQTFAITINASSFGRITRKGNIITNSPDVIQLIVNDSTKLFIYDEAISN
jgi:hypothetical protein